MSIKSKVNSVRRRLMQNITRNIGSAHFSKGGDITKVNVTRILICRPNPRLGNQLLMTPLLQEVIATFPNCKIDLFVNGNAAPSIFQGYEHINKIIRLPRKPFKELIKYVKGWMAIKAYNYDIVINVVKNSSSGRLSAQFANADFKFFGDDVDNLAAKHTDYDHIAKYPVYNFRHYLQVLGFPENNKPVPSLNLKLSTEELANAKNTLQEIVKNDKKTLCIFTFATGDKCYKNSWWQPFYNQLKERFPEYNIVEVLPVENVSQINFEAPSFYSKDIREIAAFIANTELFVGADSGMMHLASASLSTTVGLFCVTNEKMYTPYGNGSFAINTNTTTIEEAVTLIEDTISKKKKTAN
ncbi:glycosyltransferase family 9 protein [Flavobacterium frigidarium]|uniref:glycosyltransferase family 9 protein n=1 Tax=Flavobacterium frigidarium TaxID=99286 RepID=UPI0004791A9F|nr:glycosyltransferase family 9 protein [Flavobacterium frigidarium]